LGSRAKARSYSAKLNGIDAGAWEQ